MITVNTSTDKNNANKVLVENDFLVYQLLDSNGKKQAWLVKNGNKNITEIEVPNEIYYEDNAYPVTRIEEGCFSMCNKLRSIGLPPTLKQLGEGCFSCCSSLNVIQLPYNLEIIGNNCFVACEILEIDIPSSVRYIGYRAFMNCPLLRKVRVFGSNTIFGNLCFYNCTNLIEILFAYDEACIYETSIYGCEKLNVETRKHIKEREKGKVERFYNHYEEIIENLSDSRICLRFKRILKVVFDSDNIFSKICVKLLILLSIIPLFFGTFVFLVGVLIIELLERRYNFKHENKIAYIIVCLLIGLPVYILLLLIACFINTGDFNVWNYAIINP